MERKKIAARLLTSFLVYIILHVSGPTEGAVMRRREAGSDAAPSDGFRKPIPGRTGAPPGGYRDPPARSWLIEAGRTVSESVARD